MIASDSTVEPAEGTAPSGGGGIIAASQASNMDGQEMAPQAPVDGANPNEELAQGELEARGSACCALSIVNTDDDNNDRTTVQVPVPMHLQTFGGSISSKTTTTTSENNDSNEDDNDDDDDTETDDTCSAIRTCDMAARKLRELALHLEHGSVPTQVLHKTLEYAACVLESIKMDTIRRPLEEDEDDLSEVQTDAVPNEVRKWLETTFTRNSISQKRQSDDKLKFRSVANAIRAGIVVDKIYRRMSGTTPLVSPEVATLLKHIDDWSFDCFSVNQLSNGQVLKNVAFELFNRYGLLYKFKIPTNTMRNFLTQVEAGYVKHKNPYHNNLHAADVTQTVHFMLWSAGLANWLSDLEIFATLFAAIVHDYLHTGTTNNFHVMSRSETALVYNDRSVLENFHISAAFRLLLDEDCNILANLSNDDYREFRSLVIDMVLATDMSSHFQQIKAMKTILNYSEFNADKSKILSLVIHVSDISHPAKRWELHSRWTQLLMGEFFRQGDKEKQLNLECSPLCDRDTTLVAESQLGFIEFIVNPSMEVCGDVLERVQLIMMGPRAVASPTPGGQTGASTLQVTATGGSVSAGKSPRRMSSLPQSGTCPSSRPTTPTSTTTTTTTTTTSAATSSQTSRQPIVCCPTQQSETATKSTDQHTAKSESDGQQNVTLAANLSKYNIKPDIQHPVIKLQQSDMKQTIADRAPSLQTLSTSGDEPCKTRITNSAPATQASLRQVAPYRIERPWVECLERNKRMWQERAVLDAQARAEKQNAKFKEEEFPPDDEST